MEPSSSHASILIVDDEPAICRFLEAMLSAEGFLVQTCTSGAAALELLAQGKFKIVLSDLYMPEMDGLELLEQVRSRFPHLDFIMTTGSEDVGVAVRAMKEGAADYLLKPIRPGTVVASIHRAVLKKSLEHELEQYRYHLEEMLAPETKQLQAAFKRIERTYEEMLQALKQHVVNEEHREGAETTGGSQKSASEKS